MRESHKVKLGRVLRLLQKNGNDRSRWITCRNTIVNERKSLCSTQFPPFPYIIGLRPCFVIENRWNNGHKRSEQLVSGRILIVDDLRIYGHKTVGMERLKGSRLWTLVNVYSSERSWSLNLGSVGTRFQVPTFYFPFCDSMAWDRVRERIRWGSASSSRVAG